MFKAFWDQGDSYSYNFEYKRLRANKDGDTTDVFSMGGIRTLTVVSADEEGYTLRYTADDTPASDPDLTIMMTDAQSRGLSVPILFHTDPDGDIDLILNADKTIREMEKASSDYADYMLDKLPKSSRKVVNKKALKELLMEQFNTSDKLAQWFREDVGMLFTFFGGKYKMDKIYEDETTLSVQPQSGTIYSHTQILVPSEYADDYSAVCEYDSYTEDPRLKEAFMGKAADTAGGTFSGLIDNLGEQVGSSWGNAGLSYEENFVEEVHMSSGWPIYGRYTRSLNAETADGNSSRLDVKIWKIIVPEGE